MDDARVSDQERSRETLGSQRERGLDSAPRVSVPVGWKRSAGRGREGVEPKCDRAILGPCARALDQSAKAKRLVRTVAPKIQFEMWPRIEIDAIESLMKCGGVEAP
jgi:hypothetical protein